MTPIACNCPQCRAMCRASTCLCSPEGAQRLIDAGHVARLAAYAFPGGCAIGAAPRAGGHEFSSTHQGTCTFFSEEGGCELHDAGMKPLEGQLAHHSRHWLAVRQTVVNLWTRADFARLTSEITLQLWRPLGT